MQGGRGHRAQIGCGGKAAGSNGSIIRHRSAVCGRGRVRGQAA